MRRLATGLLLAAATLGIGGALGASNSVHAGAGDGTEPTAAVAGGADNGDAETGTEVVSAGQINVLQVSGLFDRIVVSSIEDAIDDTVEADALALILQVNSKGAVVSDADMEELLTTVADAPVPIGVWIGSSNARLYGTPAQLLAVADVSGMAPGARVGYLGDPLHVNGQPLDFGAEIESSLRNSSVGLSDARALGLFNQGNVTDEGIVTIKSMVHAFDGYEHDGEVLHTTERSITDDGVVQMEPIVTVVMSKLSLVDQVFHSVASPSIALLLFLIGLALLVFEFYTAGVGIAGVVGAGSLVLACTGLAALPTRWWAVALIVAAMVAFAVDVQVGIPRFWSGVGLVFTIIGSFWLFEPLPSTSLRPSWLTLIAALGGIAITFITGMPSMVRTRFATPTIGREWMIGELGTVVTAVDPDGIVTVGNAQWRARTNRATPVGAGEQVRVVAIDGVTLEVEPLEGAAQDYRERRKKSASADGAPGNDHASDGPAESPTPDAGVPDVARDTAAGGNS